MQGNSAGSGRVCTPRICKSAAIKSDATKNCRRKASTTQAHSNVSTSASDVTVAEKTILGSTIGTSERAMSPSRKRSGSTSLESTVRCAPQASEAWPSEGVGDRDGRRQVRRNMLREYPEMRTVILPDIEIQ
ncbi:hypothetical protein B0H13DRAFT_2292894 [Mycena leptocephala]|nr:hypothetical protein B0H13DRAFT_2292894 [Mycena leptocephala]